VTAELVGRRYAGFHLDVGLDADPTEAVDSLVCEDHLAFAGIAPARVAVVRRERQFAEKIHVYTRPWDDRENTRVKDLIDLLLLMDLGLRDSDVLASVLRNVFDRRGSHGLPPVLQPPPASWATSFKQLSTQSGLAEPTLEEAYRRLSAFWERVREELDGGSPST